MNDAATWIKVRMWVDKEQYEAEKDKELLEWETSKVFVRSSDVVYFEQVGRFWYAHLDAAHNAMPALGLLTRESARFVRHLHKQSISAIVTLPSAGNKVKNGAKSKKRPRADGDEATHVQSPVAKHKVGGPDDSKDQDQWSDREQDEWDILDEDL